MQHETRNRYKVVEDRKQLCCDHPIQNSQKMGINSRTRINPHNQKRIELLSLLDMKMKTQSLEVRNLKVIKPVKALSEEEEQRGIVSG